MDNYQQNNLRDTQNDEYTQKFDFDTTYQQESMRFQQKSNSGLIVALSILGSVLVVLIIFLCLVWSGVISINKDDTGRTTNLKLTDINPVPTEEAESNNPIYSSPVSVNKTMYADCNISITLRSAPSTDASEITQIPNGYSFYVIEYVSDDFAKVSYEGREGYVHRSYISSTKKTISVEKNMFINCNESLTLRTGPTTNYNAITTIPVGESVYVYEYSNGEFAKVNYNGAIGYVMSKYLSDTRPVVWDYNSSEVESFVESSVHAFVNGVNTKNSDYVYYYYTGSAVDEELKSCEYISSIVQSEEIISLNCHSVKRISPMQVSVIRDSVIHVIYNDGTAKDVTEKYQYTVDYSQGSMYIVALKEL